MINYARITALSLLLAFTGFAAKAAQPAGPEGEWLVKDKTAHMRLLSCGKNIWGVISWAATPDTDKNNPDASKRSRPVLGMPILLGLQPSKDGWDGDIYNADNGKTYHGNISLKSEDTLHVKGCVLGGIICGGEDWTRLAHDPKAEDAGALCRRVTN